MPRVRYTGGGTYRVSGIGFEPGDEHDVDDDLASHLADIDAFDVLDDPDGDATAAGDDGDDSSEDASDETPPDDGDGDGDGVETAFDAEAFVDRTPMEAVIDDIHAGEADGHLDAVYDAADRVGVTDAVGERRAELED
jgi:hypothetical protein